MHWTEPFIRRLRGDVKLVGPTISCEGSPLNGDVRGRWRRNPHVQSYAIATDRASAETLKPVLAAVIRSAALAGRAWSADQGQGGLPLPQQQMEHDILQRARVICCDAGGWAQH